MPDTLFVIRRNGAIVNFLAGNETATMPEPRGDQTRIADYLPNDIANQWFELIHLVIQDGKPQQCEFTLGDQAEKYHYELQMVPLPE